MVFVKFCPALLYGFGLNIVLRQYLRGCFAQEHTHGQNAERYGYHRKKQEHAQAQPHGVIHQILEKRGDVKAEVDGERGKQKSYQHGHRAESGTLDGKAEDYVPF